jgi:hypothetical protein
MFQRASPASTCRSCQTLGAWRTIHRMLRVEFITTEDEEDLVVSFALAPAAHKSLTLLRSPQYEFLLPEDERGISVSKLDPKDQERDLLRQVHWRGDSVTVKTQRHEYALDISSVAQDDIVEAKAVLRKMIKDGVANVDGA